MNTMQKNIVTIPQPKKKIANYSNAMQQFEWKTSSKKHCILDGIQGTVGHMTHCSQNK